MKFTANVDDEARLVLTNLASFREHLKLFKNKRVYLTISENRSIRSNPLNKYYWDQVVESFVEIFNKAGMLFDKDKVHDILKTRFLLVKDPYTRVKSTTELSNQEFIEYCNKLQAWAATDFDYYIPDPNENTRRGFNKN